MTIAFRHCLTLGAVFVTGLPALAHDFWIQPSTFLPAPNAVVQLHLMVGSQLPGDPVARDPERIVEFASYGPTGTVPVAGRDGMDPAGVARFTKPGMYTVAYRSNPASVSLEPGKFEVYLKEVGLEKILKARADVGESGTEVNEIYSRCCKSLLRVGESGDEGFDRTVGLPLELTALDNPYDAAAGSSLRFRIDDHGKPCEGLLVRACNLAHPDEAVSARSGADGVATLVLPYDGAWLVTSVQMAEAPADSGAQWESLWASLTFEIGHAAGGAGGRP